MGRLIEEEPERRTQLGPKSYVINYSNIPSETKRFRAYLRASPVQPEYAGPIITNQETKIRQYVEKHGVLVASYVDTGLFSETECREGFKRLREDAKSGEVIIVSHWSRLGRDSFTVNDIIMDFRRDNIAIMSAPSAEIFHA
jgi:DNA invertase Pin-like site-specific DNA recombinase